MRQYNTRFQCSSASRKFLNAYQRLDNRLHDRRFSALQRAENSSIEAWRRPRGVSRGFSALQRAENSSIRRPVAPHDVRRPFQCSSASRKFLNPDGCPAAWTGHYVSVLFSEPKIPQWVVLPAAFAYFTCFSALQRAENSSIADPLEERAHKRHVSVLFSEPKIPQSDCSALPGALPGVFQCSSASRKFLNAIGAATAYLADTGFSALQRAENSSIAAETRRTRTRTGFSALQRAENSSILEALRRAVAPPGFSALQRAENSSIPRTRIHPVIPRPVSVLFSEPKIPQYGARLVVVYNDRCFSALQRAENSSIRKRRQETYAQK